MKSETAKADNTWLLCSSLFALAFLVLIGYLNYVSPYSAEATTSPPFWTVVTWGVLYFPVVILPLAAKRNISDFGFTLSPQLAFGVVIVFMLCSMFNSVQTSWVGASVEAFARTGEEIFFRGFLFDIFIQLFTSKRRPWLWAAILSSILFALIHTQTFQQSFLSQRGYPAMPAISIILQRLVNVFGLGLIFALTRVITRSILPGAIFHSMVYGGILAVPFVLGIYFAELLWAYKRGERISFGIPAQARE